MPRGECLFRRIIEEARAPGSSPGTRERITQATVRLAEAADHANVGTVEFLMDEDEYFYFIEMNTPGVDLVKEKLKVAGARGYRWDR
jgi:acetyl/propionyl-CoA carboxylase alpha subunit